MGYGDEPLGGRSRDRTEAGTEGGFGGSHATEGGRGDADAIDRTVQELFGDRSGRAAEPSDPDASLIDRLLDTIADGSMTVEQRIDLQETLRSILLEEATDERIDSLERLIDAVATAQRMLESDFEDLSVRVHRLERAVDGTEH